MTVIDVTQEGKATTYTEPGGATAILNDRPPLILRAEVRAAGEPTLAPSRVTVIVNHLRSLSGVDDPADGARVRLKRRTQAEFLARLIQQRQADNPDEHIVSIGDYNAFQVNDGYVDVMGTIEGQPAPADQVLLPSDDLVDPDLVDLVELAPPSERYSFMFDGNAQELDHVLITANVLGMTRGLAWGRNNADFPDVYRNDPNRSERISDHDPIVAFFQLPQTTTTTISVAPNPAVLNQGVTFTVHVSAPSGDVDGGTVAIMDGADVLAAGVAVHHGIATATLSPAAGDHTITAAYSGALLFGGSTSAAAPPLTLKIEPLALALPADIVAEATSASGARVTFAAVASNDVETVQATCAPASGSIFAIGTANVDCSATDPYGNTVAGRFHVTVADTTAPTIDASATPAVLWPPNHKLVAVTVTPHAADVVDPSPVCAIVSIRSSEADNGLGDGDTANDIQITGALTAALRAERAGNGPGRWYTIVVGCHDAAGNASSGSTIVAVPLSSR